MIFKRFSRVKMAQKFDYWGPIFPFHMMFPREQDNAKNEQHGEKEQRQVLRKFVPSGRVEDRFPGMGKSIVVVIFWYGTGVGCSSEFCP